jgi:DNA-binding NarL/FixJ family response regulator
MYQERVSNLSPREFEVLTLVAEGYTDREIGRTMFLAVGTIKAMNSTMRLKLNAKSRAHAVSIAYRTGILLPEYQQQIMILPEAELRSTSEGKVS